MVEPSDIDTQHWRSFILENTTLTHPPLVPEIKLYLAEQSLPIWQKTQDELNEDNVPPPYWAFAWAGGQALARYLIDKPQAVRNKTVLDLGSGCGITALAARRSNAARVLASDIDQISGIAAQLNAAANNLVIDTTDQDILAQTPGDYGVLLVGDLFYERPLAERVMSYLEKAKKGGAMILAGDPQRTYFRPDRFSQLAQYQVQVSQELEDCEQKPTAVWQLN